MLLKRFFSKVVTYLSIFTVAILLCTNIAISCQIETATTILHNGKVFTSDSTNLWVEAVAIRNNWIVGVGSNDDILEYQGSNTLMINLQGRIMLPGFNDAHTHLIPFIDPINGMYINDPLTFIPNSGPSVQEMLGLIQYLDTIIPLNVSFFGIVGESFLEDSLVSRFLLDIVAPNRPVIIFGWAGHFLVLNTAAMQAVGISETQNDPFGGSYDRVEDTNIVNGVLREYAAYDFARRVRSAVPDEVFQAQLTEIFQGCLQMGYTSVQDVPIGIPHERYRNILEGMNVPLRIRNIAFPYSIEEAQDLFNDFEWVNPLNKVQSAGIKWITDGTPQESYMCLTEEYLDQPGWFGQFNFLSDDFNQMLKNSYYTFKLKKNQIELHCQGDSAIQIVLDNMSDIGSDWGWRLHRPRIVHGDMIMPEQYSDVASKGICIMKIPSQFIKGEVFFRRLGPERFQYVQPLKSLIDNNVKVVLCSDTLGGVGNPFLDIKLAMFHPTNPSESISIETAVIHYTAAGAYSEYMEYLKGTLQSRRLADLIVLSKDIFDPVNWANLEETFSILTIINGEIVWDAGMLL